MWDPFLMLSSQKFQVSMKELQNVQEQLGHRQFQGRELTQALMVSAEGSAERHVASAEVFGQICTYFNTNTLCITQFSNFIFLGDFNVNVEFTSPLFSKFLTLCPYIPWHKLWTMPPTLRQRVYFHYTDVHPIPIMQVLCYSPTGQLGSQWPYIAMKWKPVSCVKRYLINSCDWNLLMS